jgi:predicted TPR repeat methyltransferase
MSSAHTDPVKQQVAAHWDRRAAHFDQDFGHSIRTPAERAAWDRIFGLVLPSRGSLDALDLGCGTGLGGAAFRPFVDWLGGVDLSPAMVAQATAKGLYDCLVAADIAACLVDEAADKAKYHLVVAADVFVYLNDLAPIIAAVAQVLTPGGIFAFTVETHVGGGVKLLPTLRYAHGEAYVRAALADAGLAVEHLAAASVRSEKGVPVDNLVVVASLDRDTTAR